MNKNVIRVIGITAACAITMMGLTACGKKVENKPIDSAIQTAATAVTDAIKNTETTTATENETVETTIPSTETVEITEEQNVEENDPSALSNDWKDRDVMFDGMHLDMPCDWGVLREDGWDFQEEIMKQMEIAGGVGTTVKMVNEGKYPGLVVEFNFDNTDENNDTTKAVPECLISGFNVSADGDKYPAVTLGGGITWGVTRDAVISVFGDPAETVENEDKTTTLHYEKSFMDYMDLTFNESGLCAIAIN